MSRDCTSDDRLNIYNEFNRLLNHTDYPFDLKHKLNGDFVPTYKEISIYYNPFTQPSTESTKPDRPKIKKSNRPPNKHGGAYVFYY